MLGVSVCPHGDKGLESGHNRWNKNTPFNAADGGISFGLVYKVDVVVLFASI